MSTFRRPLGVPRLVDRDELTGAPIFEDDPAWEDDVPGSDDGQFPALEAEAAVPRCCWCQQRIIRFDESRPMGGGRFAHLECATECAQLQADRDHPRGAA
ncbi:MAG TPA: hypothetical protein VFW89_05405 [Gemmatimonadaceae bacterium]|nr:hypothetical protein [Gemmatimonadaceae bacterium]